jgi:hypothetical protein
MGAGNHFENVARQKRRFAAIHRKTQNYYIVFAKTEGIFALRRTGQVMDVPAAGALLEPVHNGLQNFKASAAGAEAYSVDVFGRHYLTFALFDNNLLLLYTVIAAPRQAAAAEKIRRRL